MAPLLLLVIGAGGGVAVCLGAARVPNPWARAGAVAAAFLLPWYGFMPLLERAYPDTGECSFICISDGAAYAVVLGVGWCGGIVAAAIGVTVWRVARRIAHPAAPPPPPGLRIAELAPADVGRVDGVLPLAHRQSAQTYLVAWNGETPVGHVHVKWKRTETAGVPETEDLVALEPGVEQALVEAAAALVETRGYARASK